MIKRLFDFIATILGLAAGSGTGPAGAHQAGVSAAVSPAAPWLAWTAIYDVQLPHDDK